MDKRVNELRERLWKKKAALQQKENVPVSARKAPFLFLLEKGKERLLRSYMCLRHP